MSMKKGKEHIYESFRDKRNVVLMGLLCTLYFSLLFTGHLGMLAQILPPLPWEIFVMMTVLILTGQGAVWKAARLFHSGWYKDLFSLLLFFCEFALTLFVIVFLSWPFYLLGAFIYHPK